MAAAGYLRKFSHVGYWQPGQETGDAGFFHHYDGCFRQAGGTVEKFPPGLFWRAAKCAADFVDAAPRTNAVPRTAAAPVAMSEIHSFSHSAMATQFQMRIADEEKTYAAQTAQAAFALTDRLESLLSRFRANSEISADRAACARDNPAR